MNSNDFNYTVLKTHQINSREMARREDVNRARELLTANNSQFRANLVPLTITVMAVVALILFFAFA